MKTPVSRRSFLKSVSLAAGASAAARLLPSSLRAAEDPNAAAAGATPATAAAPANVVYPPAPAYIAPPAGFGVAPGPFQPTWESLSAYQVPDWFRDAKFGIWAHWGPQCQPEQGDWYAQRMYQPNNAAYKFHVERYGHPSKFGFKDVINEWKADQWDPNFLVGLYKRAGAKYFAAMANHHDNLDLFDSTYQPWNTMRVGPKKDIVGGWAKAAREHGLRLSLTCHGDRAWSWYQDAQRADTTGPLAGVHYDGLLSKADGKGRWWDGLDPQDLYAQYHPIGSYGWTQSPGGARRGGQPETTPTMPLAKNFSEKFFNRTIDLINKYQPDQLYFDDTILPIYPSTDIGLRIAAYLYNRSVARSGKVDVVITTKGLTGDNADKRKALVLDIERGVSNGADPLPWQTDTCIGDWHYKRSILDGHRYKTVLQVVQMLVDIVSKNGCLQLNVPLPGNGMPDSDELSFIAGLTAWMDINSEGIYATRPWKTYGEGPSVSEPGARGQFGGARDVRAYTAKDFRYVQKGDTLFAFAMGWPEDGKLTLTALAEGSPHAPGAIERVELLGMKEPMKFTRDASGLVLALPEKKVGDHAYCFRINGRGLVAAT